ncbi:MAG: hypothetical protein VW169_02180 [Rhodospirillaceae bacterium]
MASNLLERVSGRFKRLSESRNNDGKSVNGVDLEKGTINIDVEGLGHDEVGTRDVFREGDENEGRAMLVADDPSVYIIDLHPFYKAIGTETGSRLANGLLEAAENMLERRLKGEGNFTNRDNEIILFRFRTSREDGLRVAVGFVNEIGRHFLRDAYKSEDFVEQVINMSESKTAVDDDGNIDVDNALKYRLIVDRSTEQEFATEWDADESDGYREPMELMELAVEIHHRHTSEKIERTGVDRRQMSLPFEGEDRRKKQRGRRDEGNPSMNVWRPKYRNALAPGFRRGFPS